MTVKLGQSASRRDAPRDNRLKAPGRVPQVVNSAASAAMQLAAPQPASSTAMESAFSKLADLKSDFLVPTLPVQPLVALVTINI
jgi:hypothetical protein